MGTALTRRTVGTQLVPVGVGARALLRRRLSLVEQRAAALTLGRLGCVTCAGWPPNAVTYPDPPQFEPVPGAPRYCRPWMGSQGDGGYGAADWPDPPVCPGCGRQPENIIRIVYAEEGTWRTGFHHRAPALADWRPGDTS